MSRQSEATHGWLAESLRISALAWPVSLAHLGTMLLGVVDVLMVGRLGEQSLAAVSLGHTWSFSVQVLLLGTAAGLDPLFSQAYGAGNPKKAGQALVWGAVLLAALALPVTLAHFVAAPVLVGIGQPPAVVAEMDAYVSVRALGVVPFAIAVLARQSLQGAAVMWPGAVAIVVGNLVNFLVNGMLLFGWFGAPQLGVAGAAWATVASTLVMAVIVVLLGVPWFREMQPSLVTLRDRSGGWVAASTALPVGVQVGLEGWGFSFGTVMAGWLGPTALAANAVALTLASLAFMVPLGLSSAAATRVGNLLGAGKDWRRAGWTAVSLGIGVMALSGLVFVAAPKGLSLLFVQEAPVVALAAALLPVAAGFGFFDGAQVVLFGVLRGAGDTAMPAAANIVGYYVIGLPLAAWLAFGAGLGIFGVWLGLAVALACVSALLAVRLVWTGRRGGFRLA